MFSCVRCVTDLPKLAWQDPPTGARDNGTGTLSTNGTLTKCSDQREGPIERAAQCSFIHSETWSDPDKHSWEKKLDLAPDVEMCKLLQAETINSFRIVTDPTSVVKDEWLTDFFSSSNEIMRWICGFSSLMNGSSNFIILITSEDVDFLNLSAMWRWR